MINTISFSCTVRAIIGLILLIQGASFGSHVYAQSAEDQGSAVLKQATKLLEEQITLSSKADSLQSSWLAQRIDTSGKGEFETRAEYERRTERIDSLREVVQREVEQWYTAKKGDIALRIDSLSHVPLDSRVTAHLGYYDADRQVFPVTFDGMEYVDSLLVPREFAREFKELSTDPEVTVHKSLYYGKNRVILAYGGCDVLFNSRIFRSRHRPFSIKTTLSLIYGSQTFHDYKIERPDLPSTLLFGQKESELLMTEVHHRYFFKSGDSVLRCLFVLTTAPEDYDCHSCAPLLGAAILRQQGPSWIVEAFEDSLGQFGGFGKPASDTLVRLGADLYALRIDWGNMYQGVIVSGTSYFLPVGNTFLNVLTSPMSEDAENTVSETDDFNSTVISVKEVKDNSEHYPISMIIDRKTRVQGHTSTSRKARSFTFDSYLHQYTLRFNR